MGPEPSTGLEGVRSDRFAIPLSTGLRNPRLVTALARCSCSESEMAAQRSSRERDCIIAQPPQRWTAVKAASASALRACLDGGPALRSSESSFMRLGLY